jgi:hypothetical protein
MRQWLSVAVVLCLAAWVALEASPPGADEPRFTPQNELIRPEGYREWIFIGASLGMSYEQGRAREQRFHNLYLHPRAYQEYKQTGRFPEKTLIVMEVASAGSQASINRQGQFEDRFVGVEAAVKDSSRFPESWAYFNFTRPGQSLAPSARAFPKEACWDCHRQHGATDNVFTQFYPVLRETPAPPSPGASRTDGPERR